MFPLIFYVSEQTHKLPDRSVGALWAISDMCTEPRSTLVRSEDFLCAETLSALQGQVWVQLRGNSSWIPNRLQSVDLVCNQTVELKPDSGSKMVSPQGYCDTVYKSCFSTFFADNVLLTSGTDKVDVKQHRSLTTGVASALSLPTDQSPLPPSSLLLFSSYSFCNLSLLYGYHNLDHWSLLRHIP